MNIYIVCLLVFSVYAGGCGAFSRNFLSTVNNNFWSTKPLVSTNNSPNPNPTGSSRFGFGSLISGSLSGAAKLANGVTGSVTNGVRNVAGATIGTLSTVGHLANGVKGVATTAVGTTLGAAGDLVKGVTNVASTAANGVKEVATTAVGTTLVTAGNLVNGVTNVASSAVNLTGSIANGVKGVATTAIGTTLGTAGDLVNGVTDVASSVVDLTGSIANGVKDVATTVGTSLVAGDLVNGVTNIASSAVNLTGTIAKGVRGVATTAVGTSLGTAGNLVSGVTNVASSAVNLTGSIANGVKGVATTAVGTTLGTAGDLVNGVQKVTSSAINVTGQVVNSVKETAVAAVNTTLTAAESLAGSAIDLVLLVSEAAMNVGVDVILAAYKTIVQTLNVDEMPLPPINTFPFYVASFNAKNGFFKKLSSLSKDGIISIKRNGTKISLKVPLRFDDMEVGYKNYSVSIAGYGTDGSMKVGIKSNKVRLGLSIAVSTSCALSLDEFSLEDLDDIQLDLTGVCYYCGIVTSKVSTIMVNFLQSTIKNMVQEKMNSIMKTVISENSLCTKFISP